MTVNSRRAQSAALNFLWSLIIALAVMSGANAPAHAQQANAPSITSELTPDQSAGLSALDPSSVISNGVTSSEYVVGPGDILNVTVMPQKDYSLTQVAVDQSGQFEYPRIGTVVAAGKTVSELRDEISGDLAKYCVNPDVSIQVTALRPQVVYVTGGVKTPKIIDVRSAPTVAKAVTLADGALDNNELTRVSIFRNGKVITSNIYGLLVNGVDNGDNIALQPGDMVVVPLNTAKYAVVGAVNAPGVYPLTVPGGNEGQTRLADALAAAGGTPRTGASIHNVQIVHVMPDGVSKTLTYDYGKYVKEADETQNPVISDRDLIFIPDSRHTAGFSDALGAASAFLLLRGL